MRNNAKRISFFLVCILVGMVLSGCNKTQAADDTTERDGTTEVNDQHDWIGENESGEFEVHDEMFYKHQHNAGFVAVKLPAPSEIQWYIDEEGEGVYYEYYHMDDTYKRCWTNTDFMKLPIELQDGEFAYVKADTTFMTGGIACVTDVRFDDIKECKKISLAEAAKLIDIMDLYEYEKQYLDGFYGIARHSKVNDCLVVGELRNRYDFEENPENSFYGLVTIYLNAKVIGQFERLEFVDDYLVFFKGGEDEEETELPENITIENIEELLAAGKQYNDFMFVVYKREKNEEEDSESTLSEGITNPIEDVQNPLESTEPEAVSLSSEEILNLFIRGETDAVIPSDLSTFHITELNMDSEEWDKYSVGERVDLDNDGEKELVLRGPYGGKYLDARYDMVYLFANGEGTGNVLSYTYYNGDIWILYSNCMNAGYEAYHMEKYEGADNRVAEMNFGEERMDVNNLESEMKYTLNGKEVSYDEYSAFCSKIFAAEVNTAKELGVMMRD